jgi:acetolactate synthase-1/2/3 large subunit
MGLDDLPWGINLYWKDDISRDRTMNADLSSDNSFHNIRRLSSRVFRVEDAMTANGRLPTGAEVLCRCLEREGVRYIFGLSGGAAIPIFDALVDSPIELILVRHEQGATHMADGYARASGRPGVVLVTSGPGATNTVTGLLTAQMDSSPLIVITGQTNRVNLGMDAFQEADVTGITYPVVKHSYLVRDAAEIPRVVREAFHIATTGRPGPVLIDVPKDVSQGPCDAGFVEQIDLPGYHVPGAAQPEAVEHAAELIARAAGARRTAP